MAPFPLDVLAIRIECQVTERESTESANGVKTMSVSRRSSLSLRKGSVSVGNVSESETGGGGWQIVRQQQQQGRRDSRRGSIGHAIMDAMSQAVATNTENPTTTTTTTTTTSVGAGESAGAATGKKDGGYAKMRRSNSITIQSIAHLARQQQSRWHDDDGEVFESEKRKREVQREVDQMIEKNSQMLKALEDEAIRRTLGRERMNAIHNSQRRGSVQQQHSSHGARRNSLYRQDLAQISRRSSFSAGATYTSTYADGNANGLFPDGELDKANTNVNKEFMELIKDKEHVVMENHTSNITPLRPGFTQPAAMPMWRGYSVLEKEGKKESEHVE